MRSSRADSVGSSIISIAIILMGMGSLPVHVSRTFTGTLVTNATEIVACPQDMLGVRVLVSEGEHVSAGDVLAIAESDSFSRRIELLRGMIDQLQNDQTDKRIDAETRMLAADLKARLQSLRERERNCIVLAPVSGVISSLESFHPTKRLSCGEPFATIRPDDSDMLYISTDHCPDDKVASSRLITVRITGGEHAGFEFETRLISVRSEHEGHRGSVLVGKGTPSELADVPVTQVEWMQGDEVFSVGSFLFETLSRWCSPS